MMTAMLRLRRNMHQCPPIWQKLRADLPAKIANSPAGNVAVYTQEVEAGYRQFWRDYCATASGAG